MYQEPRSCLHQFFDIYLSLNFKQRDAVLELLRGYDFMVSYWNLDHPISVESAVVSTIMQMLEFNKRSIINKMD